MDEDRAFHPIPNAKNAGPDGEPLQGLCSVNGGGDVPCLAIEILPDRLTVKSDARAAFADEAILSLPHIGLLKATVTGVFVGGFTLAFEPSPQSKLGLYLDWLEHRFGSDASADARRFLRIVPIKRLVALETDDEPVSFVRIVDLSRSGVAFTSSKLSKEGARIRIGAHTGVIVRLFDGGAAAHFDQFIDGDAFDVMIELDKVQPHDASTMTSDPVGIFHQTASLATQL